MATNVRRVSPEEAYKLYEEGYILVDVRSEGEFVEGHPAGAYNVPLLHTMPGGARAPNPDFLRVMKAHFPTSTRLLLTCRSGQRSLRAAEMLRQEGYTDLIDQRSGFDGVRDAFGTLVERGWKASKLPISFEAEAGRSYAELQEKRA